MTFIDGLKSARSHLIFLLALFAAMGLIYQLEAVQQDRDNGRRYFELDDSHQLPSVDFNQLSQEDLELARHAWQYFEVNYQPETGLVNSVDAYHATTMWDTASYLMALIVAERLDFIDEKTFSERLQKALMSLRDMPLFDQQLPNKSYNTKTLEMVNYNNQPTEKGIGWSAIDIGRILVPFQVIVWHYPAHTSLVKSVIASWDFEPLLQNGTMFGAAIDPRGQTIYLQEGRIGYEEYAAKSFSLMGLDVSAALAIGDFVEFVEVEGVKIATDNRDPAIYHAHNYIVSESYILDALEFGGDRLSKELAYRVYLAQQKRFENTGVLTAVSEDHIDQAPYFVYNTVFTDGAIWNAITEDGVDASAFKTLSTKAAFGWDALYRTEYTAKLHAVARELKHDKKGFYAGLYEKNQLPNKALTANTNAIVLESLHFKQFGPFLAYQKPTRTNHNETVELAQQP